MHLHSSCFCAHVPRKKGRLVVLRMASLPADMTTKNYKPRFASVFHPGSSSVCGNSSEVTEEISSEDIHSGISSSLPTLVKQKPPVEKTGFDNTFCNTAQRYTSECWSLHSIMFFILVRRRKHLTGEKIG